MKQEWKGALRFGAVLFVLYLAVHYWEKLAALTALVLGLNLICFACGAGGILLIGVEVEWGDLLRYHGALLLMQLEIGGMCFGLSALLYTAALERIATGPKAPLAPAGTAFMLYLAGQWLSGLL